MPKPNQLELSLELGLKLELNLEPKLELELKPRLEVAVWCPGLEFEFPGAPRHCVQVSGI